MRSTSQPITTTYGTFTFHRGRSSFTQFNKPTLPTRSKKKEALINNQHKPRRHTIFNSYLTSHLEALKKHVGNKTAIHMVNQLQTLDIQTQSKLVEKFDLLKPVQSIIDLYDQYFLIAH